nr:hypothetical protein [Tanacetum cinerariifolium]
MDGPPVMPEDPYTYVVAAFQALPPPDYVPGPQEPEQAPPSPPLPAAASPTAESPGYILESDSEEDDDEDPEEDPVDYPADHDDDEEEETSGDDADEEDEDQDEDDDDEEEEHPASALGQRGQQARGTRDTLVVKFLGCHTTDMVALCFGNFMCCEPVSL